MMMLLLAALAALAPQETRTAARTEKVEYNAALFKYKEAEGLVESDPAGAIDRLTDIISNPKIRMMEVILKIEQRPAEYSDPYPFLPYQLRGTARVNQSKKLSGDAAQRMMAGAIEDYTESVKRNVGPSADLLKAAQARLAKLKDDMTGPPTPAKADPVVKFREKWDPLIRDGRYKSARALIDKEGTELTEEQRKGFVGSTEQQCRDFLVKEVSEFRPRFINAMNDGLDQKNPEEFDLIFKLPSATELAVTNPAIEWAREYLPAFQSVQAQKAPVHTLAAAAVASAPLEDRFENPWFKAIEGAVFQSLKSSVSAEVARALNAGKADRDKARGLADGYLAVWKGMMAKLDPKFVERHRFLQTHEKQLVASFDGFPMELADLDKLEPAIEAAFSAESPDAELAKIEESLRGQDSKTLSLESRQRLYTVRVTIGALRGLLAGKSEEMVAGELSEFRKPLRDAGGPGDVKKYGPRVEKVFGALR